MLLASRYRYNAGMGITSLLITAAVSVVFTPFLISRFGTERYGLWALGFSIVQFAVVLDAGLLAANRRFQAQASAAGDLKQVNAVLGVSLALYAPIGAVASVFVASGAYWIPLIVEVPPSLLAEFRVFMLALGAFIGLQFLRSAFTGLLFGANRVDLERFVKVAQRLTIVAMTAAFVVAWQSTLRSAALGIVFGSIVSLGLAWILVRVVVAGARPNLSGGVELALAMARFSSGVLLITIGAALLAYLPQLAIGGTLGPSAIAVYAVASLMVGYVAQAMQAISAPIFPVAARYRHERERAELAVLYVRTTRIVLLISISCSVAVAVYAPDILAHWVGAEFEPAGRLVAILLLGAIFVHAAMPGSAHTDCDTTSVWTRCGPVVLRRGHIAQHRRSARLHQSPTLRGRMDPGSFQCCARRSGCPGLRDASVGPTTRANMVCFVPAAARLRDRIRNYCRVCTTSVGSQQPWERRCGDRRDGTRRPLGRGVRRHFPERAAIDASPAESQSSRSPRDVIELSWVTDPSTPIWPRRRRRKLVNALSGRATPRAWG